MVEVFPGAGVDPNIANAVDGATTALRTVDYAHHEVHSGRHFTFSATSGDLDIGTPLEYLIHTPDTERWAHLLGNVYGALHTRFEFFEGATHTSGIHMPIHNNNRNSANGPGLIITEHADDGDDGTLLFETEFGVDTGGGANRVTGGGTARADSEWVLKQNTVYLLRLSSLTADNVVNMALSWYEHIDAN